jgi:SAM-dependent methyltransferase
LERGANMDKNYTKIIDHYEKCLEQHGDNHLGVDWPNKDDADKRYRIMLEVSRGRESADEKVSLLDFGCGTGHLLSFIQAAGLTNYTYSGLDISKKFTDIASAKFPEVKFYCEDILEPDNKIPAHDYIVMNGVFTEKRELSFDEMWAYFTKMITEVFSKANKGIAFNVMSKNVDWERDDLFHVPHDLLTAFLCKNLSRNYVIRNDYGLYEYTVYLYKNKI